ncbi:MAG TPA: hypothetical protein DD738_07835 [Ruminiclostridium sp.]|nr:hypothetical protein [Ruminiclostridium sp.]
MKTLITARFDPQYINELNNYATELRFDGYGVNGIKMETGRLIAALDGVELLICECERITKEVLEAADSLKIILCCQSEASSVVDVEAATQKKIPVIFAGGENAAAAAEYIIGLILCVSRNIVRSDRMLRSEYGVFDGSFLGGDTGSSFVPWDGPLMAGKTFGMIGFGAVGLQVARLTHALGMELLIYDPYVKQPSIQHLNAELVNLDTVMSESDFISIDCPKKRGVKGLISRDKIGLMKNDAYFVNTSCAWVLDYDALYEALSEKRIAGAGLDVFPLEYTLRKNKFLSLGNAVLTPRLASATRDIVSHHTRIVLEQLNLMLHGKMPNFICNPQVLKN